jgi:Kef-type K+ transport system membrane component KefB
MLAVLMFIMTVLAFATVASYIGSLILIGCFCAGAMMNHFYGGFMAANSQIDHDDSRLRALSEASPEAAFSPIHPIQEFVLVPFFFASIGAAIPVKEVFEGQTVWRVSLDVSFVNDSH